MEWEEVKAADQEARVGRVLLDPYHTAAAIADEIEIPSFEDPPLFRARVVRRGTPRDGSRKWLKTGRK